MIRRIILVLASVVALPAAAQTPANAVAINSDVLVERIATDASGHTQTTVEQPATVVPGDHLIFVLRYRNNGTQPATDFVVTNPLPAAVSFDSTSDAIATVSVDGGVTWGQLAGLTVTNADGTVRPARPDEVTHIRWAFSQPIPAGETGQLMFRGIVK